jgi:trans-aconitate methyltransferase
MLGRITAVDSSPEVLAINQERVGKGKVDYIQADLFSWQPTSQYDVVFFSFGLSHVPEGEPIIWQFGPVYGSQAHRYVIFHRPFFKS